MLPPMGIRYTFGHSEFDSRRGLLTVGKESCVLRPRTAAVLEQLLRRPGTVLTREELMRTVWPGLVVTANSLEQCMSELRRGLNGASGTTLRTVPRRGYLLEARVRVTDLGAARQPAGSRSMAVLPIRAERAAAARFAVAFTRELTAQVGRMPCTTVASPATVAQFSGDLRKIGHDLGVDYVVEGLAWRDAGEWHAEMRVSETAEARLVWAERLRHRGSAEESRRSLAGRVASLLTAELTALESRRPPETGVEDALAMTRRAYYLMDEALPEMSAEAFALAARATEVDERSAGPWAMVAHWHVASLATRSAPDRKAAVAAAEAAARRALALDPAHRLAYAALGAAHLFAGRLDEALVALERQMEINANVAGAHHLLGRLYLYRGEPGRAVKSLEEALAHAPRDPRRSLFLASLALAHLHLGEDAKALERAREAAAQPKPWPRSLEVLAMASGMAGDGEKARAAIRALLEHWPGYSRAAHQAELPGCAPAFNKRHARLLRALAHAGLK